MNNCTFFKKYLTKILTSLCNIKSPLKGAKLVRYLDNVSHWNISSCLLGGKKGTEACTNIPSEWRVGGGVGGVVQVGE